MLHLRLPVILLIAAFGVVACTPVADVSPTSTPAATDRPQLAATRPAATVTPTARPNLTLRFWLPDSLAGLDSVDAGDVLSEQISQFEQSFPDIQVELRLRAANGTGGLLETMNMAAQVAPGALPDVTLLRLQDFRVAAQEGLLQPLSERDLIVGVDDFAPAVVGMGQIDNVWFGVPSTLEILHVAYSSTEPTIESWRFDQLLAARVPFLFPGMSENGLSPVFLLQYLVAGSQEPGDGVLTLDENALRATLRFYERAASAGLVSPTVLEYSSPERYPDALNENIPTVVTSSLYLRAESEDRQLQPGYIPTTTGEPATTLDGWLWVVIRTGNEQQLAALRFINWMLDAQRQSDYHAAIHMLPAALAAQRQLDAAYAAFGESLLQNAVLLEPDLTNNLTARALQSAYAAVINGQSTAGDALNDVIAQIGE
ncbi:MAG: extracellular solute-binding protein [Anaerolineae bacterium]|nr:extracellular solute-binding protein [Anaerolineae bacterium]